MDKIAQAAKFLKNKGFASFCFAGSAGLEILSRVARENHAPALIERDINDVDVLVLSDDFDKAASEVITTRDIGVDECLNIRLPGNVNLELTQRWPILPTRVKTAEDIRAISIETPYGLVLDPALIAALKIKRQKPKDQQDLAGIERAHRSGSIIRPVTPSLLS